MYQLGDKQAIKQGRKKVYSALQKLELILPNKNSDGFLEVGDAIYVVNKIKKDDKTIFKFTVIKFADTENKSKIYTSESQYFKPYFENNSNAEGKEPINTNSRGKYIVPAITSAGLGLIGYLLSSKFDKNKALFTIGGALIGLGVGAFIIKNKEDGQKN